MKEGNERGRKFLRKEWYSRPTQGWKTVVLYMGNGREIITLWKTDEKIMLDILFR